jgi:hypothetical protein
MINRLFRAVGGRTVFVASVRDWDVNLGVSRSILVVRGVVLSITELLSFVESENRDQDR